ncbi:MAG: TadE/TadG family type IV pilus assembly protein [Hyphomicrobium sp.]
MTMFFRKSIHQPVKAFCQRLACDKRGVAAVEFAFVLPILAIMLLGTVEVARAVDADRRFGNATAMLTDLIAREQNVTDADLGGMMQAIAHLMRPYDPASLTLGVVAVRAPIAAGQQPKVEWSYSHNGKTVPAKGATYTLPADLVSPGSRVIVVESTYNFTPMFVNWDNSPLKNNLSGGVIAWTDKATLTPRSDCVHNSTQETSPSRCDFSTP